MKKKDRPNILIIMTDEHRIDCLGAYGNREIRTPWIDSIAGDGVVFENSFCVSPLCTPSRYSFMTGLYPHQHLGWDNHSTIPSGLETFPKALRKRGYRTEAIGKMHFAPTYLDVGFERMRLAEQAGPGRFDDDYHRYLREHDLVDFIDLMDQEKEYQDQAPEYYRSSFRALESDLEEQHHSTTWIGDRALEGLEHWTEEGNLMMVSFIKPHHPFDPPAPWSGMYDPERVALLPGWTEECPACDLEKNEGYYFSFRDITEDIAKKALALYYGSISQIDFHVGRMIRKLREKGLYEDTMIVFTSDHGEFMGFHHMLFKGGYMYDPLVKVPLVIKLPGNACGGQRRDELVCNVDVAATVIGQAGAGAAPAMQGRDLFREHARRDYAYAEIGKGAQYMCRSQTRKLIYSRDPGRRLFFNLEEDPFELNNLIRDPAYQAEIEQHVRMLSEFVLFDSVSPSHLHEQAATIAREGEPAVTAQSHQSSRVWFREKMAGMLRLAADNGNEP